MTAMPEVPLSALPMLKDLSAILPELTLLGMVSGMLSHDMFFARGPFCNS